MAFTYTNRKGKTYYLHVGPKRGGGRQYFVSQDPEGELADALPAGYEVYESVNGPVYLRKQRLALIRPEERAAVETPLARPRGKSRFKVEVRGKELIIHESSSDFDRLAAFGFPLSPVRAEELAERFAHYQPVMRFLLVDEQKRVFAPERFCFRGSVDDWISIGPPEKLDRLVAKYLKHLGQESLYELY